MTQTQPNKPSIRRKALTTTIILVAVSALVAFGFYQRNQTTLERYHNRFIDILPANQGPTISGPPLASFPPLDQRRMEALTDQQPTLSLTELFNLKECELQQVIIQRNTALGKVGDAYQQLIHDHQFIEQAPQCITQLQEAQTETDEQETDLIDALTTTLVIKRKTYRARYWNATLGSAEFKRYASTHNHGAAPTTSPNPQALQPLGAITESIVAGTITHPPTIDTLQHWYFSQDLGQWQVETKRMTDTLNALTDYLTEQWPAKRLCPAGSPSRRSRDLLSLVKGVLAEQLQPSWVEYRRFGDQWVAATQPLLAAPKGDLPPAMLEWIHDTHQLHGRSMDAIRRHAQTLSQIFAQCGLTIQEA